MAAVALLACGPVARPAANAPTENESQPAGFDGLAGRVFAPKTVPLTQGSGSKPAPTVWVLPTTASSDRGASLFGRKGCAVCHGAYGEGLVGPRIARTPLSFDSVVLQVRVPNVPRMPPFPPDSLADAEVADIYAYLQSLDRE